MRFLLGFFLLIGSAGIIGCAPEHNPFPTREERECLSDLHQLTAGFSEAGEARFSPDGDWIMFQGIPTGESDPQVYLAKLEYVWVEHKSSFRPVYATPLPGGMTIPEKTDRIRGLGRPVRITPEHSSNRSGCFSVDGNSIYFASTAANAGPSAADPLTSAATPPDDRKTTQGSAIFRADGWLGAIAASEPGKIVDLARHPLTGTTGFNSHCILTPDGHSVLFASDRSGNVDLFAMRADGTGCIPLVTSAGDDQSPSLSPDGQHLVYRSDRSGDGRFQIFFAELRFGPDGAIAGLQNEHRLTDGQGIHTGPVWHADGKHLLFSAGPPGEDDIQLMTAEGKRLTRITFSRGADDQPVVSPDGKFLMWSSRRTSDKSKQLFIARLNLPKGS